MQHKVLERLSTMATRHKMQRVHVFGALLLIALVAGIQVESLRESRDLYQEHTRLTAQNLANALAESIGGFFRNVDITLLAVIDQTRLQEHGGLIDKFTFNAALETMKHQVPGLTGLRVTDEAGMVKFGTNLEVVGEYSVADREYFQRLKANPRLAMLISEPLISRSVNKWALVCARPFYRADGQFGGVAFATVELEHLAENVLGQRIDLGEGGVFGLGDDSQNLILRYVHNKQEVRDIGKKIASPELQQLIASKVDSAYYSTRSKLDQKELIAYFRRVPGQPLSVAVGLATDDALSGWRQEANVALATSLLFALLAAGGSWALYRTRVRHLATAEELAGAYNFNQKVIESSEIGICVHRQDGLCIMANPALGPIVGATHDQLLQVNFRELATFKQTGALELAELALADGSTHRVHAKVVTKFGKELWLQWVFTSFVDRGERFLLVLMRDVTEIQTAREELESSNRKLAILSTTDGLTGLANRRHFDEMLETEWRRAARQKQPLALAMIDVDLFKKYNDHYGHQSGDECLRQVAGVLSHHAGRAGDLVARYGGEEFAFIGPATGGENARELADVIRSALEQRALPHAQSSLGIVTISVGVAAMIPMEGKTPFDLLRQADEALYLAKRQGRNRVVLAED